jgi:restriction endonuclease
VARQAKDQSISQKNDASCINNKRGMAHRAKRNSNKRDRQFLSRETVDLIAEVEMSKKFSQQELVAAFEQMREERLNDKNKAQLALDWVISNLGVHATGSIGQDYYSSHITNPTPYPITHVLLLNVFTYSNQDIEFTQKLENASWAQKGDHIVGFHINDKFYKVTTPFGEYPLTFSISDYW